LDSNPLPEHVQEVGSTPALAVLFSFSFAHPCLIVIAASIQVIHTKGALGLLVEKAGTGGSPNVGTMRGTLRSQMMASSIASINISPAPGSRGSVILSPRVGLEKYGETVML
jgi:hypothetical protein